MATHWPVKEHTRGSSGNVSAIHAAPTAPQGKLTFGTDIPNLKAKGNRHTQRTQKNRH